ncbi:acyl-CoA dehydrogenase family protein [Geobacillus sp. E263]|uniref:acyl-CoA dehydrogenase family protein n=1 Tax=Geobacillus sp. E263 TaxID=391290 RepID=UPI00117B7DA4|nr:acyl-CoA dehydrogenase family protein [Geobacillus sp. E263]
MDFSYSPKVKELIKKLSAFMEGYIYPNEKVYKEQLNAQESRWSVPPIMEELKAKAKKEIAMIKVVAPNVALKVIDRAIQAFGAAGVSDDFPLAAQWANARTLRLADGPDEVHKEQIAKLELRQYQ